MLDDTESLHGSGSGSVYDGVRPHRRPVRPRPARLVAEADRRAQQREEPRNQAPAPRRAAAPLLPEPEPVQQEASQPERSQPVEAAKPLSRMARRRAARAAEEERAQAAEKQAAAERARAEQERLAAERRRAAQERAATERARAEQEQAATQLRQAAQTSPASGTRSPDLPAARPAPREAQKGPAATQTVPVSRPKAPTRVPVFEEQDPRPAIEISDPAPAPASVSMPVVRDQQPRSPQKREDSSVKPLSRTLPLASVPGLEELEEKPAPRREARGRADQPAADRPGRRQTPVSRTLPLASVPGLEELEEEPAPRRGARGRADQPAADRPGRRRTRASSARRTHPGGKRPTRPQAAGTAQASQGALAWSPLAARGRMLGMAAVAGVVLLWLLAAVLTSSTVSARTVCSGVPIGGLSHDEAVQVIETALAEQVNGPLSVSADGATVQLSGSAVKAKVDGAQSIRSLTRFTMNPRVILQRVMGGQEVKAVVTADPEAVRAELYNHLDKLSHGAVSAQVSLVDGQVQRTAASAGTGVDLDSATEMLSTSWPVAAGETIVLPEGVTEPAVTDAEASAFAVNVLEPLVSGPVTLTVAGTEAEGRASTQTHELSAEDLKNLATVKEEGGTLAVVLDPTRLREQVLGGFGTGIETQPTGYKWTIDGSEAGAPNAKPQLEAAAPGQVVDGEKLSKAIVEGVSKSGASAATRTVTLELSESSADTSGEAAAQALGIKEVVGSSDTPFESDPQRDQNLRTGTAAVNGTLVLPGQSYSMAQTIGPVEPERGYAEAGVIVGSKHVNGMGGGLSQVTTTVFNAAYAAGMEDDEHTPHSQYMSRYPAGLEATLWSGQIDMRFTNTTPYAVLLQAWVGDGHVHVRAWSTHHYDVEISTSDKFNIVPQGHSHSMEADCFPNPEGQPGFDITVTRRRSLNGTELPTEVRTVHYEPNDSVTCG
ncbi:VanW family protein [Actinomyces weissii]|uniref:VanW family protein n=1 Tax=Actinomyces weissii TaxID=675090 RepID=A0A7T7M9B9_9ACTO|nr:VanW family protein [Actinomyces weissii]QQM67069.1 VanW family protein [Actinomyces weissii]